MKALEVILMLLISGACVWIIYLVLDLAGIFVAPLGIFMGWLM